MDFDNTTIIDKAANYRKRLFLEAWNSQRNSNVGNDHIDIPDIYVSLSFYVSLSYTDLHNFESIYIRAVIAFKTF